MELKVQDLARKQSGRQMERAAVIMFMIFHCVIASAATRYVNLNNSTPSAPYITWETAATTIQDAVDAAASGDLILVTNGVYQSGAREMYGMSNRVAVTTAVRVESVNGREVTIIAGHQVPETINGREAIRCIYLTNGATLVGFTLTNGATQSSGDFFQQRSGGGVWCESTSEIVSNCVLLGNSASYWGGGAYLGRLSNCILTRNSVQGDGGGAASSLCDNCDFTGNSASLIGGGAAYGTLNN
jgi:parallel beta-helix repeat protein